MFNLPLDEERYQATLDVSLFASGKARAVFDFVIRLVPFWRIWQFWRTATRVRLENEEYVIQVKINT